MKYIKTVGDVSVTYEAETPEEIVALVNAVNYGLGAKRDGNSATIGQATLSGNDR